MRFNLVIKNYRCFEDSNPIRLEISPGFTAFIGPNNSGKSSLLKFFYESREMWRQFTNINTIAQILRSPTGIGVFEIPDGSEIFCRNNSRDIEITITLENPKTQYSIAKVEIIRIRDQLNACKIRLTLKNNSTYATNTGLNVDVIAIDNAHVVRVVGNQNIHIDCQDFCALMQDLANCVYIGPFRNAINQGAAPYYDMPVGTDFISRWDDWKHGNNLSNKITIQKVTDDIKRIFRFNTLEIEANADRKRLDYIVNDQPYRDSELGAGLSEFVMTLGCAATKPTTLILIDEPEIHLHPALQVDYLTSLATYAKDGILFATHSIGLARAVADDIFSCKSRGKISEVVPFGATAQLAEFLGEMSFSSYSELGFKKILLVEGPTDLRVIQQWLRLKQKDHEIVMLSLGGNSLASGEKALELSEIKRIHPDVWALVDSERESEDGAPSKSRSEFEKQCKELKIPIHLTKRRALDNYLPDQAVKAALGEGFSALGPYDRLKDSVNGWSKTQNWRIAREMAWNDLEHTDVGEFLQKIMN